MSKTYRAIQPTEKLSKVYMNFGDGIIASEAFTALVSYINTNGSTITNGKRIMFYSTGSDDATDVQCSIEYVENGQGQCDIYIRINNTSAGDQGTYRVNSYGGSLTAYTWYVDLDGTWMPQTGYPYIGLMAQSKAGVTSVTVDGVVYTIDQTKNDHLFSTNGIGRARFSIECEEVAHIHYGEHSDIIDENDGVVSFTLTADSGYTPCYEQVEHAGYSYDESTHMLTLHDAYGDVYVWYSAQPGPGPGPTPTNSDDYCYVDRIKKFITRMEGNKFSEVE